LFPRAPSEPGFLSIGAMEYMTADHAKELFENEGIKVELLKYNNPRYPQFFGEFVPDLSVIHCLFKLFT